MVSGLNASKLMQYHSRLYRFPSGLVDLMHYCEVEGLMLTQITTIFSYLAFIATMTSYQINCPKFDWEATDKLTELQNFKEECNILFEDGPYKKTRP